MKYELVKSSNKDIDKLISYKKNIIFKYANDLSIEEINEIDKYSKDEVNNHLNDYYNIIVDNKMIGSLVYYSHDDGLLLDEIYIEESYRNLGIATSIINDITSKNNIVYLWVYKDNNKAVELYKRLGFIIIDSSETRYYMKHII